jgi:hypothetical protein
MRTFFLSLRVLRNSAVLDEAKKLAKKAPPTWPPTEEEEGHRRRMVDRWFFFLLDRSYAHQGTGKQNGVKTKEFQ